MPRCAHRHTKGLPACGCRKNTAASRCTRGIRCLSATHGEDLRRRLAAIRWGRSCRPLSGMTSVHISRSGTGPKTHLSRWIGGGVGAGLSRLSHMPDPFNIGKPNMPYENLPKRGGFLKEYPRWHAALREHFTNHKFPTGVLDSWGPRVDPPQGRPSSRVQWGVIALGAARADAKRNSTGRRAR